MDGQPLPTGTRSRPDPGTPNLYPRIDFDNDQNRTTREQEGERLTVVMMMILQPALRRPTYNKSTAQNEQQRKRDHWRMDDREQLRETRCRMSEGREWYRDMRGMGGVGCTGKARQAQASRLRRSP